MKSNGGGENARKNWNRIINDFKPDLIHIHGSESMVPYELIKMKPNITIIMGIYFYFLSLVFVE